MTRATRKVLAFPQRLKLHERIKNNIEPLPNGLWAYINGVNDKLLADEFGVTEKTVGNLRRELFGDIRVTRASRAADKGADRFGDQIAELRGRVARLETELSELRAALGGG